MKRLTDKRGYGWLWKVVMLTTCFGLMLAVAVRRDRSAFGVELSHPQEETALGAGSGAETESAVMEARPDGSVTINSSTLAHGVKGYGGPTPVLVTVSEGRIDSISALPNAETPSFFKRASEKILPQYQGKSIEEALVMKVDAVSGATMSSEAIKANVSAALEYADPAELETLANTQGSAFRFSWKWLCALVVALGGALIPLWWKSKRYRVVQLALNVGVLGFWSGTFLSYARMLGYLSSGLDVLAALVPIVMLITAFIYPIFGKPNHYCTWTCPLGSLQDLASMTRKKKLRMSPKLVKWLTIMRETLWLVLMTLMWLGAAFGWMDYELFSAFLVQSVSWVMMAVAGAFILLSVWVSRPYCRFVCPTGSLFKVAETGIPTISTTSRTSTTPNKLQKS